MNGPSKYHRRGVSASKEDVHAAIKGLDKGLFPTAFCKILPDLVADDSDYCNIMHADTAGTKTSLAYIYWRETGDLSVWDGIVQDAVVMNIDDMACAGCINDFILSSTVGRNKHLISAEVITRVIQGTARLAKKLAGHGIKVHLAGGETADVGDIVRTIDVGITAFGRMRRNEVIKNEIVGGQVIVGLASYGKATYEDEYNGGMGSNGLTSARHDVLEAVYRERYPESYDEHVDPSLIYSGSRRLDEVVHIPGYGRMSLGKLILSPTRTYLPVIRPMLNKWRSKIAGLIHCTGGGLTKVLKFVHNKRIVKDNLHELPPLFQLIESESGTPRSEMYEVFNMGQRLEVYTDSVTAKKVIELAKEFNIHGQIIGRVEEAGKNELIIQDEKGEYLFH